MTDPNTDKDKESTENANPESAGAGTPPPPPESNPTNPPPPAPEPETTLTPGQDATVGNRLLAVIIDSLIAGVLSVVPAVGPILAIAYMVTRDALPFLDGQSVGKKAMKLRAVSAETGKPLTNDWGPSVIRNIVLYIPFFPIVELIVLMNNDQNQRLGDQWAKTKVVVEPGV